MTTVPPPQQPPPTAWDQVLGQLHGVDPTSAAAAHQRATKTAEVLGHWHEDFADLPAASPQQFYSAVERHVERWQIPGLVFSRVDWHESGIFSAKREYLRVSRGKLAYDICAAPFGSGFFISSWMAELRSPNGPLALLLVMVSLLFLLMFSFKTFGLFTGVFFFVVAIPVFFVLLAAFAHSQSEGWDDALVAMPLLGPLYARLFAPETYYKKDTQLLFQTAVHSSVMAAIDEITQGKGIRGLTDLERQPVMRDLFAKR